MVNVSHSILAFSVLAIVGASTHRVLSADVKDPASYKGRFISYDPERKTLRVDENRQLVTFVVDPGAKVTVDDNRPTNLKLAELAPDTNLLLALSDDLTTVLRVNVVGPMRSVTIEAIDIDKLTMRVRNKRKKSETYTFQEVVPVTNDKTPGSLADLKPGGRLQVKMSVDMTKAMSIRLLAPKR